MAQSGTISLPLSDLFCDPWIIDSGASNHMIGRHLLLIYFIPYSSSKTLTIANGSKLLVLGMGSVILSPSLYLDNVLFIPSLIFLQLNFD